jgi:hypothetical protein
MTEQRTEEFSAPRVSVNLAVSGDTRSTDTTDAARNGAESDEAKRTGDAQRNDDPTRKATVTPSKQNANDKGRDTERDSKGKKLSAAKVRMQDRLPALEDDADIGVEKEHIVTRDGKADLLFMGVLLASAAPASAPKGDWQEYRIYRTNGDKHVFSRVTRKVREDDKDTYEADVFDPAPSSVPSQLLRSAREIARARPMTWMDAAVAFFGYDPLAKALYRKLSVRFEEQIT